MSIRTDCRDVERDLALLADAFFLNLQIDNCEYGGIGLDSKRPFGNSDADEDILEIIGAEPEHIDRYAVFTEEQRDYARDLYQNKLIPYLQRRWNEIPPKVNPKA